VRVLAAAVFAVCTVCSSAAALTVVVSLSLSLPPSLLPSLPLPLSLASTGYAHTSKLLAEVGMCLSSATCRRESSGGGVMTVAAATNTDQLRAKLRAAKHEDGRPLLTYDVVGAGTKKEGEF
jgi:hypothetical protein